MPRKLTGKLQLYQEDENTRDNSRYMKKRGMNAYS